MQVKESLAVSHTKKGARVWLNNMELVRNGLGEKTPISISYFEGKVIVRKATNSKRTVAKGNIIDLQNHRMTNSLGPDTNSVFVHYNHEEVILEAIYSDAQKHKRESTLRNKLKNNKALSYGELCMGFGLLGESVTKGMEHSGVHSEFVFGNDYCRHAADVSAHATLENKRVSKIAKIVHGDLFSIDKSTIPNMDIMFVSYPCVGFTNQQSTNRKRDVEHEVAGLLFVPLLEAIGRANPAVIVLENSDKMANSDTDFIISTVLDKQGYKSSQTNLSGTDFGDFEKRTRLAKVFYSKGLTDLSLDNLPNKKDNPQQVKDIMEPISNDSPAWRDLSYLRKKNDEKHHSHKFVVSKPTDTRLPAFLANYGKTQCDGTFFEHPTNPELHRIASVSEHANVRKVSAPVKSAINSIADGSHHLQKGRTNATKAHFLLGNSVSPSPWIALGARLGNWLLEQSLPNSNPDLTTLLAA